MTPVIFLPGRDLFGYTVDDVRYLNVTSRCTLRCSFCPKYSDTSSWHGKELLLSREPTVSEIVEAASIQSTTPREIVFSGLGEPTLRLYEVLEAAACLRRQGARIRIHTDGLANLVYRRDVTPDFEGIIDALSVSLNAHNANLYDFHCRPTRHHSYPAVLEFVAAAREYVPDITLTAIAGLPGVDLQACERTAKALGVNFQARALGFLA